MNVLVLCLVCTIEMTLGFLAEAPPQWKLAALSPPVMVNRIARPTALLPEDIPLALDIVDARRSSTKYKADPGKDIWFSSDGYDCEDFAGALLVDFKTAGLPAGAIRLILLEGSKGVRSHVTTAIQTKSGYILVDQNKNTAYWITIGIYTPLLASEPGSNMWRTINKIAVR